MRFDSWQAFLAMGGHGLYVWLAYATALALLIGNYIKHKADRRRTWRFLQSQAEARDHASKAS